MTGAEVWILWAGTVVSFVCWFEIREKRTTNRLNALLVRIEWLENNCGIEVSQTVEDKSTSTWWTVPGGSDD